MPNSLVMAMSRLMFRGMDMMRDREAFDIGAPTATDFTGFDRFHQIVLVTFKRSGAAMPSPINHGVADSRIYVRTDASTGKMKRLRNNPRVVVVPCSFRGKPKGQPVAGIARILPEAEHAHAGAVIAANWTPAMKVFERTLDKGSDAFGLSTAYIEITPAPTP
ncbi:MAG: PPOX class F420-dependent oxidoreductase [Mycobacterium sp.]|nr:PPOX class F420-dependent oxidoreductase [Mycobacterium sp.]